MPQAAVEPITFQAFRKIPRLFRSVVVSEKLDGMNGAVVVTEDGQVLSQGRKRFLTLEDDDHGFAAWVKEHEDELRELGPGVHYGEFWGHRINRGYGLKEKRFSLFNVKKWDPESLTDEERRVTVPGFVGDKAVMPVPACCHVVPVLSLHEEFCTESIDTDLAYLREFGSQAAPGFMNPEGIVVLHEASGQRFKVTLEGDDVPKGSH